MVIWLVISPYISHVFFDAKYEYINHIEAIVIPFILLYLVIFIRKLNFNVDFYGANLKILLSILIAEVIFLNGLNYLSRGGTAEMIEFSSSMNIGSFLVSKFIVYSNILSFLIGAASFKKNPAISLIIILLSCVLQYNLYGLSKAAFINLMVIFLIFSGLRVSVKSLLLSFLYIIVIIFLVTLLRGEVYSVQAAIKGLVVRTDGLSLIFQDSGKNIDWFSLASVDYFNSLLASILRLIGDNEMLSLGLSGPKAVYLYNMGYNELDYSASFLTDMIILFGYFFGIITSMVLVIFLHGYILNLSRKSLTIGKMTLFYSMILSSFMVDRSLLDYFFGIIKTIPFIYLYLSLMYPSKKRFSY